MKTRYNVRSLFILAMSCGSFFMLASAEAGTVTKIISGSEAEVSVGRDDVKTGDTMVLHTQGAYVSKEGYSKKTLGTGKVTSVDGDTARVKLDGNAQLSEQSYVIFADKVGGEFVSSQVSGPARQKRRPSIFNPVSDVEKAWRIR